MFKTGWRTGLSALLGLGLPLGLALLLSRLAAPPHTPFAADARELIPLPDNSPASLLRAFESFDYAWPPAGSVPPLAVETLPPGLESLPVDDKKSLFFRALLPLVLAENARILERRAFLETVFAGGRLDPDSQAGRLVRRIAERYQVSGDINDPAVRELLLRRVDIVPPALVLAQAANESGWGSSRFAREANNLFGIWTWNPAAGLVPESRPEGAEYYVRVYPDVRSSIRGYLHNINVGHAYRELRQLRAEMRAAGIPLDPLVLAGGLDRYSTRGEDYVAEIRSMISGNELERLRGVKLAPEPQY